MSYIINLINKIYYKTCCQYWTINQHILNYFDFFFLESCWNGLDVLDLLSSCHNDWLFMPNDWLFMPNIYKLFCAFSWNRLLLKNGLWILKSIGFYGIWLQIFVI